jgi:phosphatidylserine/phosphatidylglycerophosphate/cardiolipin synthase-like enzyme
MKYLYLALGLLFSINVFATNTSQTIIHNYPENMPKSFEINQANYAPLQIEKLIKSAEKSIDIEVFYIDLKKDSILDQTVIQPLIEKAHKNIKIRILVDNKFYSNSKNNKSSCNYLNSFKNIICKPTKEFNDSVMHTKMIIVDGKSFYLGSHNFDWITFELNHELGIIVRNNKSITTKLENSFNDDWKNSNSPRYQTKQSANSYLPNKTGQSVIAVTPDDNLKNMPESNLKTFIKLINSAKQSIYMQAMLVSGIDPYSKNKYWPKFTEALINATKRGVNVEIMFSDWMFAKDSNKDSNKWLQSLIQMANLNNLKIKYTALPKNNPCIPYSAVNHAKYAIFDKKLAWISSSNIQKSYFYTAKNYSYIINDPNIANQLIKIFNQLWNSEFSHSYTIPVGIIVDPSCTVN